MFPPSATPPGTKGRILEAALELFATRGYAAVSIRDLAAALKLQPGALYVHFRSKEHLLAELVRLGHEAHHRALRAALMEGGTEPVDQLRSVAKAHARFHADYPMAAVLIDDEMHHLSQELGAAALAVRQQSVALISEVIDRGVQQGKFKVPHPFVVTAAVGAMGMRVAHWYRPDFELSPEQIAEVHAELAVRMVGG